jgi:predicted nucleic acid-binding protein
VKLVVDASVAAKWFNVEELSDKAANVKDAHVKGDIDLAAPIHLLYEVGNSIWRNKQLSDNDACDAISSIIRLDIQLFEPTVQRAQRAMEIARQVETSFYDAVYLQVAEEMKVPILTADQKQIRAGRSVARMLDLGDAKV